MPRSFGCARAGARRPESPSLPTQESALLLTRGRLKAWKDGSELPLLEHGELSEKVSQGSIFPREDGKIIDEHFGALHTRQDNFSLAHMTAPPGWREPAQIAEFDEVVIVVQGMLLVETDNQRLEVGPDETCLVSRGTRVTYSNASQVSQCIYWSLCLPAFRPERTHIEDN